MQECRFFMPRILLVHDLRRSVSVDIPRTVLRSASWGASRTPGSVQFSQHRAVSRVPSPPRSKAFNGRLLSGCLSGKLPNRTCRGTKTTSESGELNRVPCREALGSNGRRRRSALGVLAGQNSCVIGRTGTLVIEDGRFLIVAKSMVQMNLSSSIYRSSG